jgi:hypothetical protein
MLMQLSYILAALVQLEALSEAKNEIVYLSEANVWKYSLSVR